MTTPNDIDAAREWQPIETAPRDGEAVLLLSVPYELDAGPNGKHWIPAKCAIGKWWADGTSGFRMAQEMSRLMNLQRLAFGLAAAAGFNQTKYHTGCPCHHHRRSPDEPTTGNHRSLNTWR